MESISLFDNANNGLPPSKRSGIPLIDDEEQNSPELGANNEDSELFTTRVNGNSDHAVGETSATNDASFPEEAEPQPPSDPIIPISAMEIHAMASGFDQEINSLTTSDFEQQQQYQLEAPVTDNAMPAENIASVVSNNENSDSMYLSSNMEQVQSHDQIFHQPDDAHTYPIVEQDDKSQYENTIGSYPAYPATADGHPTIPLDPDGKPVFTVAPSGDYYASVNSEDVPAYSDIADSSTTMFPQSSDDQTYAAIHPEQYLEAAANEQGSGYTTNDAAFEPMPVDQSQPPNIAAATTDLPSMDMAGSGVDPFSHSAAPPPPPLAEGASFDAAAPADVASVAAAAAASYGMGAGAGGDWNQYWTQYYQQYYQSYYGQYSMSYGMPPMMPPAGPPPVVYGGSSVSVGFGPPTHPAQLGFKKPTKVRPEDIDLPTYAQPPGACLPLAATATMPISQRPLPTAVQQTAAATTTTTSSSASARPFGDSSSSPTADDEPVTSAVGGKKELAAKSLITKQIKAFVNMQKMKQEKEQKEKERLAAQAAAREEKSNSLLMYGPKVPPSTDDDHRRKVKDSPDMSAESDAMRTAATAADEKRHLITNLPPPDVGDQPTNRADDADAERRSPTIKKISSPAVRRKYRSRSPSVGGRDRTRPRTRSPSSSSGSSSSSRTSRSRSSSGRRSTGKKRRRSYNSRSRSRSYSRSPRRQGPPPRYRYGRGGGGYDDRWRGGGGWGRGGGGGGGRYGPPPRWGRGGGGRWGQSFGSYEDQRWRRTRSRTRSPLRDRRSRSPRSRSPLGRPADRSSDKLDKRTASPFVAEAMRSSSPQTTGPLATGAAQSTDREMSRPVPQPQQQQPLLPPPCSSDRSQADMSISSGRTSSASHSRSPSPGQGGRDQSAGNVSAATALLDVNRAYFKQPCGEQSADEELEEGEFNSTPDKAITSDLVVKITSVNDTPVDWPARLIMDTRTVPILHYSCNPGSFDAFKALRKAHDEDRQTLVEKRQADQTAGSAAQTNNAVLAAAGNSNNNVVFQNKPITFGLSSSSKFETSQMLQRFTTAAMTSSAEQDRPKWKPFGATDEPDDSAAMDVASLVEDSPGRVTEKRKPSPADLDTTPPPQLPIVDPELENLRNAALLSMEKAQKDLAYYESMVRQKKAGGQDVEDEKLIPDELQTTTAALKKKHHHHRHHTRHGNGKKMKKDDKKKAVGGGKKKKQRRVTSRKNKKDTSKKRHGKKKAAAAGGKKRSSKKRCPTSDDDQSPPPGNDDDDDEGAESTTSRSSAGVAAFHDVNEMLLEQKPPPPVNDDSMLAQLVQYPLDQTTDQSATSDEDLEPKHKKSKLNPSVAVKLKKGKKKRSHEHKKGRGKHKSTKKSKKSAAAAASKKSKRNNGKRSRRDSSSSSSSSASSSSSSSSTSSSSSDNEGSVGGGGQRNDHQQQDDNEGWRSGAEAPLSHNDDAASSAGEYDASSRSAGSGHSDED